MKRRIPKFYLLMENGAKVYDIKELRENADIESIIKYFVSGQLRFWLKAWGYDELAVKIADFENELYVETEPYKKYYNLFFQPGTCYESNQYMLLIPYRHMLISYKWNCLMIKCKKIYEILGIPYTITDRILLILEKDKFSPVNSALTENEINYSENFLDILELEERQ